ncbi:MAG: PRC-barrel domain-containing protein [Longimicrobiales bacterium]
MFDSDRANEPLSPQPDLAGLAVHDADDLRVGRVFGVLADADHGLIRYLDVDLEGAQRHVLVPIGHARLQEGPFQPRLRLRAARLDDLRNVPTYDGDGRWRSAENARMLAALYGRFFRGDRYYAHPAYDHTTLYAGPHPVVLDDSTSPAVPLVSLAHSDYRVARDEPNVIGWTVTDALDAPVGRVVDLLFDPSSERVRYVVVEMEGCGLRLLPIGYLELAARQTKLLLPGLHAFDVENLPEFKGDALTGVEEKALLEQIELALDARNPFLRVAFSDRKIVAKE